jgi:DNA-binding GntR family transcriptional regulator
MPSANQSTGWLSDELLQQVKNDIAAGKLTRLSFRHLQRTYQISHTTAKQIRQALLRQGIAQMDETTHQLTLTGKMIN